MIVAKRQPFTGAPIEARCPVCEMEFSVEYWQHKPEFPHEKVLTKNYRYHYMREHAKVRTEETP